MKRKICFVTGSRAEYGLLRRLMQGIKNDPELELQIIATCMHLSTEFGLTYQEIENDGFLIDKKVEILLSADTPAAICKSMGLSLISLPEAYGELKPDILVLLGDRFETFCAAAAGNVCSIPIAHIHGGEKTIGAIDESFRHSITKMSHIHFASTEEYRNRVIQLGENPNNVFCVGSLGVENVRRIKMYKKDELEKKINFRLSGRCIIVTFHPVTLEQGTSGKQFNQILSAIRSFKNLKVIFTKANADTEGRIINQMIDDYVNDNPKNSIAFESMGQHRYLSAIKHVDAVVGNSSSGIIEAPCFKIPTINIGDRQKGRIQAESIINCSPLKKDIEEAFKVAFSERFNKKISNVQNPYEKSNTSQLIKETIKKVTLDNILKKEFYDINHDQN